MPHSIFQVAKTIGQLTNWSKWNLEIQKIAYLSEIIFLGRENSPLISEEFEAWAIGPICPTLYHEIKVFGSRRVKDVFSNINAFEEFTVEFQSIRDVVGAIRDKTPGEIVRIAYYSRGAWAKKYKPGVNDRKISKQDMLEEYEQRKIMLEF